MDSRRKILTRGQVGDYVAECRSRGLRVALANGCFDVLHVGHIRYLQSAKHEAQALIVGINSDSSTRRLKGQGRPVLNENARAQLVAAIAAVDGVVIFDEPDVTALLEELRPDVHVKGTDYTPDTVPERETAKRLGIRVAIVGDAKQHSTRELLGRVRSGSDG